MRHNYLFKGIVGIFGAGVILSATESQWFYSLFKINKSYEEIEFRQSMKLMDEFYRSIENNPIKIETFCPTHRSQDYIPASKFLENFSRKEDPKTNKLEKCIFRGEETDRVI